ncbi:fused MFS/spermidine synthase [bacterium]|nr:fused MFS/spermidine synthase [bacterium]
MSTRIRNAVFVPLLFLAFFASGAASLVAEVTWNRMLIVVVGNSLSAAAMIIMVFMGGLGLGSWLGGRWVSGRRMNLVPYLLLETVIGLYVLASPALFDGLTALFTSLAGTMENREGLTAIRLLVTSLALLLPATLMGATFPAIIAGAALDSPTRRSARTGYLYSTNTLGAAIGCFAAGYHLLQEFGVQFTLNTAFVAYLVAAGSALAAHLVAGRPRADAADAADPAPAATAIPGSAPDLRRFLFAATFVVGFVSLAYEVLLTRVSILYLGNTVSVFPLVLTAFLLGTGFSAVFGTWLFGVLQGRGAGRVFGVSAVLAGLLLMVTPYLLLSDLILSDDRFAKFADAAPQSPLPVLGMLILPVVFMGALLPLAIRMLQPQGKGAASREAATLYSLNTAGGLLGAGIANHYLVPNIGLQGTLALLTALLVLVGVANLAGRRPARGGMAPAVGVALAVGLVAAFALPDMTQRYAGKLADSTTAERVEIKWVKEGHAATVTVLDQFDPRLQDYRDMYLNGVEEASTRFWHVQLFKLLGVLPPLLHESDGPKDAMVIAFGAGITAGSVLASDEIASLDVVDLNPDIEGINDLFTDVNGDVFHKDRFHFHNDDGRNYLVTCNKQYDVIISDSTHPRAYDSWILYTEEFYRAVKQRLKPGGVWAQWVPVLGSMRGELMQIHLNTFRKVFPTATVWYVYGSDQAFLLATPEPLAIDAPRLQAKLDKLPAWFKADHYQIDTVPRVAGFFWMSPETMDVMIGGETRVNTDGVHYFDKQSVLWPLPPQRQMPAFQTAAQPFFTGLTTPESAAIAHEQKVAGHLGRYAFHIVRPELDQAWCLDSDNGNVRFFMAEASGGNLPGPDYCGEILVAQRRLAVEQHPNNALALNGLADALAGAGRLDEAEATVREALAIDPENGMILDTRGWIEHLRGDQEAARATLEQAARALDRHPIVLFHLGEVAAAAGDVPAARAYYEEALRADPDFANAAEARAALAGLR